MGGSLGARTVNAAIVELAKTIEDPNTKIILSVGKQRYKEVMEEAKNWPKNIEVFEYIKNHNIQAAIVSGNNREVLNVAVRQYGLQEIFPKDKINRIGCKDATGRRIRKSGGDPTLFTYALKQLEEAPDNVLAFGNEVCDAQAAANAGIKAYHCLWGAKDLDRTLMLNDPKHQSITSPIQIIDILRSEKKTQSQAV